MTAFCTELCLEASNEVTLCKIELMHLHMSIN
uniref:Uncharacterized protein n=1 Tax=Anguilla anguilla TaxID=7936 RepID=A0A0E9UQQ5_ANGAN